jgi:hypothetical protein
MAAAKWLVAATVALVYASYWLVMEPSQAHAFYTVSPVAFLFAAYCWTFVDSPRWRRAAAILLGVNILFHIGQAWIQAPEISLYRNRDVVTHPLKEPEIFATAARAVTRPSLQDPSPGCGEDVQFSTSSSRGTSAVARGRHAAHSSYVATAVVPGAYRDEQGDLMERHDHQRSSARQSATLEVNDGS